MARSDRLKEEIGWLKLVFGVLVAVDASLIAWLAQSYMDANPVVFAGGLAGVAVSSGAIIWVFAEMRRLLQELEEA